MPKLQLGNYYRVVVVGDPYWPSSAWKEIRRRLEPLPKKTLLITSEAQGVATYAELAAHLLGYKTKVVKAEWKRYGGRAHAIRNLRILEEFKPQLMIVFGEPKSADLKHIIKTAEKRGIPIEYHVLV